MTKLSQRFLSTLRGVQRTVLPLVISCVLPLLVLSSAQAQTLSILHTFMGAEGCNPIAGPTLDQSGNLYGTTSGCGPGPGTVFKLTHTGTGWVLSALYNFTDSNDIGNPWARVIFGPDGALYGTTSGSNGNLYGTVFRLAPPSSPCHSILCPWTHNLLYAFTDSGHGRKPGYGDLVFDRAGNIYGTTVVGGAYGEGTVYQLTHANGGWTESVLYSFSTADEGGYLPYGGVVLDGAGNAYGTTEIGAAYGLGGLFQLTQSGSSWTETALHSFAGSDGYNPLARPIIDQQGNLYGTTSQGPVGQSGGVVYELQPLGGTWTYSILVALPGLPRTVGPVAALTMDAAGNLYGTSQQGGSHGDGSVFKLTRSGDSWIYTDLHDFNGQDGANPEGSVALDAQGNVYGTTFSGGGDGHGEVWEITP